MGVDNVGQVMYDYHVQHGVRPITRDTERGICNTGLKI